MNEVWVDQSSTPERVVVNQGKKRHVGGRWRAGTALDVGRRLIVHFELGEFDEPFPVKSVEVTSTDPLKPSDLARFPWTSTIRIAEAWSRMIHFQQVSEGVAFARAMHRVQPQITGKPPRRPGRAGRGAEHYEQVAKRYQQLRLEGVRNPNVVIASETNFNVNTVRGWVKECRRRGLLPPASQGRAG